VDVIRNRNFDADVFRARHVAGNVEQFNGRKVFAVAGIGDPLGFEKQLKDAGSVVVGTRWFVDHHDYSTADLASVRADAHKSGAAFIATTEKDWVKIEPLKPGDMEIRALPLRIDFIDDDARRLLNQILKRIGKPNVSPSWKPALSPAALPASVAGAASGGTAGRSSLQ
jgi:tetraacyldisaccharide 4'-kinase